MTESFDIEEWNQFLKEIGDDSINGEILMKEQERAVSTFHKIEIQLQKELNESVEVTLPKGFGIDKFEVVEEIGRGGMSKVYLAKRNDGLFDQQVAIKLLSPDLLGDKHESYFDAERKILARLNHPNISRILDGGMIQGGIPYLVMEYVEGASLDNYLELHQCILSERIDIFQKICEAVRHAHGQLILHRDLKPSNVIIGEGQSVKLLDFGIGGFMDESHSGYSEGGTLRFLPPEHFIDQEYTVRSDIYQLGLLGYMIFEGQHTISGNTAEEITLNIKEGKREEWNKLRSNKGLIAILDKSTQLEPENRYATVDALMIDLDFYLQDKPIKAIPSNWQYNGLLFLKRNKLRVAFSFLIFSLAIAFAVWSNIQANRIKNEKERALAANEFLTEIFRANNPNIHQGTPITAADLLRDSEFKIASITNKEVRADMSRKLGELYQYLSMYNESYSLLQEALDYYEKVPSDHSKELVETYLSLCTYYQGLADYPAADSIIDLAISTLEYLDSKTNEKMAECLNQKSHVLYLMGSYRESLNKSDQVIRLLEGKIRSGNTQDQREETASQFAIAWMDKSRTLVALSNLSEALFAVKYAIEILENEKVNDFNVKLSSFKQLATVYEKMAEYDSAVRIMEDLLVRAKHAYGDQHIETASIAGNLGAAYYKAKKYSLADSINELAYEQLKEKLSPTHTLAVGVLYNLATSKQTQGQYEEAAAYYQMVLDADIKNLGEDHPYVGGDYMTIGMVYNATGQYQMAETFYLKSLGNYRKALGEEHYRVADVYRLLGRLYEDRGKGQAALKWYQQSISITEKILEPEHPDHKNTLRLIKQLERKLGF